MTTQAGDPRLDALDALVGTWDLTSSLGATETSPQAVTTFEWLEGGRFLIQRWRVEHPDAPDGIAVIGYDDERETFLQHYFDSRGVARVYEMSLDGGTWRLERTGPDFAQRFVGVFDESGATISGAWEISMDGTDWDHDFDLIYRRDRR